MDWITVPGGAAGLCIAVRDKRIEDYTVGFAYRGRQQVTGQTLLERIYQGYPTTLASDPANGAVGTHKLQIAGNVVTYYAPGATLSSTGINTTETKVGPWAFYANAKGDNFVAGTAT